MERVPTIMNLSLLGEEAARHSIHEHLDSREWWLCVGEMASILVPFLPGMILQPGAKNPRVYQVATVIFQVEQTQHPCPLLFLWKPHWSARALSALLTCAVPEAEWDAHDFTTHDLIASKREEDLTRYLDLWIDGSGLGSAMPHS